MQTFYPGSSRDKRDLPFIRISVDQA